MRASKANCSLFAGGSTFAPSAVTGYNLRVFPSLREPRRLKHGQLTVLHEFVPGPLTAIAVAIRAGSRRDGRHLGIAHMAEHMLFQGTETRDQQQINRRAGELGGEHDADTGYEDMTLHFEVFNDDVGDALELLGEQLFHSTIPPDRFAKERRVVIDEIRGRQEDPANMVHEQAWSRFFGGPLGHPICGTIASVRRMTPAAVQGFVARHCVPANMVLSVVGGVTSARLLRAVRRAFPTRGMAAPRAPRLPRRPQAGELRLRRRDLTQAYFVRLMRVPAKPRQLLALSAALEIVGADPDARLFQEVRERLGLGYDIGASLDVGPDWGVAVLFASASRQDARRLHDTIDRTCTAAADGFAAEELERVRKKIRYRFARLAQSNLDRALSHASRAACGQPSLAASEQLLASLRLPEVERAWRDALRAPALTAVMSG
jgi:predicted Zn-dependent peptidase